jgi:hypothetical protein
VLDLSAIPIVDHHCHSLLRLDAPLTVADYPRFFTESGDADMRARHASSTIFFRWATKELAAYFGCPATSDAVVKARAEVDPARMLDDAGIATLILDHGYQAQDTLTPAELGARVCRRIVPILRLETLAQDLIVRHETFDAMMAAFDAALSGARADGHFAFKSIVAYRTGLDVRVTPRGDAAAAFLVAKERARRDGRVRLAFKPLNDYLLLHALDVAARDELPVQIHTGFGDDELDLRGANPLHLRPVLTSPRYARVPFCLLHAGYPYTRELSYLAAVHANVYMDVGLAVPYLATDIPAMFRQALSLAPTSKLLFSTDAYSIPEIFWLAARWGRWGLGVVLDEMIGLGALDADEAMQIARDVLGGNAARVYRL